MLFYRKPGIVNVKMIITEEKILSNIDKVQKMINPNSKKQIVELEDDAYFKDLNKLEQGDIVLITYENVEYKYEVSRIYEVDESDLSILKSNGISKLTLLTCKENDDNIRLIVEAILIDKWQAVIYN